MNKTMIESYVRNLVGQVFGAMVIVSQTSGQDMHLGLDRVSGYW